MSLRSRVGIAYAKAYRRVAPALDRRLTPRSVRADRDLMRLDRAEPASRRYGQDRGRPVDRAYIEGFIAEHAADVRGRVLEVAEPTYTRRFGGAAVERADVLHAAPGNPEATLVGDLTTGDGIPERAFDCLILTQTFSAIFDVRAAVAGAHAALRPGGVLLASVPGITPSAHQDEAFPDYWRFTAVGLQALLRERFDDVAVTARGNLVTARAFLGGLAEHELPAEAWERDDPHYEVVVLARAVA